MDTGELEKDPLTLLENRQQVAPRITPRIAAQESVFTVHADPTVPLMAPELSRVIIPASSKVSMRMTLLRYGIRPRHSSLDWTGWLCLHGFSNSEDRLEPRAMPPVRSAHVNVRSQGE